MRNSLVSQHQQCLGARPSHPSFPSCPPRLQPGAGSVQHLRVSSWVCWLLVGCRMWAGGLLDTAAPLTRLAQLHKAGSQLCCPKRTNPPLSLLIDSTWGLFIPFISLAAALGRALLGTAHLRVGKQEPGGPSSPIVWLLPALSHHEGVTATLWRYR